MKYIAAIFICVIIYFAWLFYMAANACDKYDDTDDNDKGPMYNSPEAWDDFLNK